MDTDDLTEMAYKCIHLGYEASDYLRCNLGLLSKDYKDEDSWLNGILEFVKKIEIDPVDYLVHCNIEDEVELETFEKRLKKLKQHIEKTLTTPFDQRGGTIDW